VSRRSGLETVRDASSVAAAAVVVGEAVGVVAGVEDTASFRSSASSLRT